MNGTKEGDKKVTYIRGREETVIDYVLRDRTAWEKVERLEVEGKIDSDHRSLMVRLAGRLRGVKKEAKDKEEEKWMMRKDWLMEAGIEFGEKTEEGSREIIIGMEEWNSE